MPPRDPSQKMISRSEPWESWYVRGGPPETPAETRARRERGRREYQFLSPTRIWFQRHKENPYVVAEVCLVNNKYRWRVFDGTDNYRCREGEADTLSEAKQRVFAVFTLYP